MKNILKVMLVIIGTLIGAGFASGKEVYIFFNKYGINGMYGVILSGIIISIVIYKVFKIVKYNNISTYEDLVDDINNNKKTNKLLKNIINVFLLLSFFIMISGFATYFNEQFGINSVVIAIAIAFVCLLTFNKNIDRNYKG